jgi:hypothetical protein
MAGDGFYWQKENPKAGGRMWLKSQIPCDIVDLLDQLSIDTAEVLGVMDYPVRPLWGNIRSLTILLNKHAEHLSEKQLSIALTLLYIASGVAWHWLRILLLVHPIRHANLDEIEPLEVLLKRTERAGMIGKPIEDVGQEITEEVALEAMRLISPGSATT